MQERLLSPEAEVTRLLSNLYKPWSVRAEETNARVINSDALIDNYIEKKPVKKPRTVDADGFARGLVAPEVEPVVPEESDEELLLEANQKAETILAEAREEADALLAKAQAEVEKIREEARKQGIAEGQTWLEEETARKKEQLEADYRGDRKALETEYIEKRKTMEADLVDVILKVFNKVFHIQFDNKKQILVSLIDDAIMNIEGEKHFRIKVAEDNLLFLENNKEDILNRVGHDIELEILADSSLEGNDCIIETDSGVFDCSLGTQLENLIKDIRSLCS
ncbi:MAG: flagellar biosynthesis protein [Roseburia sp.]|nr:flagellar biosynthesis protein [Roseburia sp.]